MDKNKAIKLLEDLLGQIGSLKTVRPRDPSFIKWNQDTEVAIKHIFPGSNGHSKKWKGINFDGSYSLVVGEGYIFEPDRYQQKLEEASAFLSSLIDEIKIYWDDETNPKETKTTDLPKVQAGALPADGVFIIHGHDNELKETVARFIEKLGLKAIILHEQPNEGNTIIEKFEKHSSVGFAIALLTPDDIGGKNEDLKPRARQNVIFEMGYFLGKLGRNRVCGLKRGNIEIPSDYDGVIYIEGDDAGAWKHSLVKELKAAGFSIDANKIF